MLYDTQFSNILVEDRIQLLRLAGLEVEAVIDDRNMLWLSTPDYFSKSHLSHGQRVIWDFCVDLLRPVDIAVLDDERAKETFKLYVKFWEGRLSGKW